MSIALGGCLRGEPVRYGITEDTGGHITYILGEMEALARNPAVSLAEIVTRRFDRPDLGSIHGQAEEWLSDKLVIRRIDSGDARYLSKESLAADRKAFIRALIADLQQRETLPDLIHAHFADAADVAIAIEEKFGIPFVYTAHSLGLDKLAAAKDCGPDLAGRIAEEDRAIARASWVVGSSRDECERQLLAYKSARIEKIQRLIPGIARPSFDETSLAHARGLIEPFLRDPDKPMILAIARPVAKKNLAMLVDAFGENEELRSRANLVIVAGLRSDLVSGEAEQVDVLGDLLQRIDRHDLYGRIAYPKSHDRRDISALYELARRSQGIFVNPALIEPYGLTLIEAAAHGLPVVATREGGPKDILAELEHGILVDPRSKEDIAAAIRRIIEDTECWQAMSKNALENVGAMSWDRYAEGFVGLAQRKIGRKTAPTLARPAKLVVSDLDNTLTGCPAGARRFDSFMRRNRDYGFVAATGRSIVEAQRLVREWDLPTPIAWITSVGTEIYFASEGELAKDKSFAQHIGRGWNAGPVREILQDLPGLVEQPEYDQSAVKVSYFTADEKCVDLVRPLLLEQGCDARVIHSHGNMLDVIPPEAGKGAAMVHLARRLGIELRNVLAIGDSGNDRDMLMTSRNPILVGNFAPEMRGFAKRREIYVSHRHHAAGALEGILMHRRRSRQMSMRNSEVASC